MRGPSGNVRFVEGPVTLPRLTHVYLPELHRQLTERSPVGPVGRALQRFVDLGPGEAEDPLAVATARAQLHDILKKIELSLRRNRVGLDVLPPVHVQCFTHWQVRPTTTVTCLMPCNVQQAALVPTQAGRFLIRLPTNARRLHQTLPREVRTSDGQLASPRKLHVTCARLWKTALMKHGVSDADITVSLAPGDLRFSIKLACGWHADLVPCLCLPEDDGIYYVTRDYASFETQGQDDLTWKPCFSSREYQLLCSICRTDGSLRMRALHLLCHVLPRDWRLRPLTCYHLQTAVLHDVDFHVDFSPRWQRRTLEGCVHSILATLLHFLERQNLPHFDLQPVNLWAALTPKQLAVARSALERLLTNENALISLLRRALVADGGESLDVGLT
ncbi:uncharacterized protein LOC112572387 isoform X3 [Pomacea canaliculata]|uniref:uncharacterized protein LOC112572387 isoform X3 n=1 Tax=Pomacea canaliculata TaxID=400727 RepID=UPI000D73E5D8|nr:uncharacterized protein LOC112572387 isoform X3 [Pomacea canaliculata]